MMKATVEAFPQAVPLEKSWVAVYSELFKAQLTLLVLLTTAVGVYVGSPGNVDYLLMCKALTGTGLLAAGAAALNQLMERDLDALMRRTRERPLPSGRLQPGTVLLIGATTSLIGLATLGFTVNRITCLLGAASLASYLLIYTPMTRIAWMNTLVGAIPGALPPLMGWTAARGEITSEGLALFAILAFWQLPHFMAIAWIYRDEYARAGFQMLPMVDPDGHRTGRQAVSHTLALIAVSLCPFLFRLAGPLYLVGALTLGGIFIACALGFSRQLTIPSARRLFYASILYLPLLLGAMVIDKVR